MGTSKNLPFPLFRRGIKGEAKQKKQVFRDALMINIQDKEKIMESQDANSNNHVLLIIYSKQIHF